MDFLCRFCSGLFLLVSATFSATAFAAKTPLWINEDNDHFYNLPDEWISAEGARRYVDNFAEGHVTHFVMCVTGQRTSYDSKTWEPIWTGLDEEAATPTNDKGTCDHWAVNAKKLVNQGVDVYKIWIDRCRENGVSPWVSMRMNDLHAAWNPKFFRNMNFTKFRKDLWRDGNNQNELHDWALDYAKAEVRDFVLRQVKEIANKWDMDGIELDWMRHGIHLRNGREREDARFLTEFMRKVRYDILDVVGRARGKRIKLSIRVPYSPWVAGKVGYNVTEWVREGLVDVVIPTSFYMTDPDIEIEKWTKSLANAGRPIEIYPCIDSIRFVPGKGSAQMTTPYYRWMANRFYEAGAKGLYLFNAPYVGSLDVDSRRMRDPDCDTFKDICEEGLSPEAIAGKPTMAVAAIHDFPPRAKPKNVPELLKTFAGKEVKSVEDWEKIRRPELLDRFLTEFYGKRPAAADTPEVAFESAAPDKVMMDGKAVRKLVNCRVKGPLGELNFRFTAFIPTAGARVPRARKVPVFLFICNRDPVKNIDPERLQKSDFLPVEDIIERGYASVTFFNGDVTKDGSGGFDNGVFSIYEKPYNRTPESWGVLSAWAWGASRVMDWIIREPTLDGAKVAVIGHSRGGKTALLAGATDTRFAMAISNGSGCMGDKLNHMFDPMSEHFDEMHNNFWYWFCGNFEKYRGRDVEIDFDQHEFVALMAPRLVAIGSGYGDRWAGPEGQFECAKAASPAWELYGLKGIAPDAEFPKPSGEFIDGAVSYHQRLGGHDLNRVDWKCYLDFAAAHGW